MVGASSVDEFFKLHCFCFEPVVASGFQSAAFLFYFLKFVCLFKYFNYSGKYALAEDSVAFSGGVLDCIFNHLATN